MEYRRHHSAITGLSAGIYTVTATDSKGCTRTGSVTINPGQCLNLAANTITTEVSCYSGTDGTATVYPIRGSGNFSYSWNTVPVKTTQTVTGLAAGTYTVLVTDNTTGCSVTATAAVGSPAALSAVTVIYSVRCNPGNTGGIDLTVSGGRAPYTFAWTNPGSITEDLDNIGVGTYTVTITDANGCTLTKTATVTQPQPLVLTMSHTDATQAGLCQIGTAGVSVSGGVVPYSYLWSNGATTATLTGLGVGTYTVTVTDIFGCAATNSVTITCSDDRPIANVDVFPINEDTPLNGNVQSQRLF